MNDAPAPSPEPTALRVRGATPGWVLLGVLLAALLAQGASLGGSFALDDVPVVQRNPALARGLGALPRLFNAPSWPGELEVEPYRPMASASLLLERGIAHGQASPWMGHALNLLLHALATALLLSLLLAVAPRRPLLAVTASLLVAVHPLAASSVAVVTGRSVLLGLCWALVSLRAWVAYRPGRESLLPLAALALFLSLLSCEAFVALPLVALLLDVVRLGVSPARAWRSRWIGHLVLASAWGLWFALWLQHGPGSAAASVPPQGVWERLGLGLEALGRDLVRLVLPVGFVADRSHEAVAGRGWPLVGVRLLTVVLAAAGLLAALLVPARQAVGGALRAAIVAAGLLLLGAALTLPPGAVLEDRWGYLALPALAVLGGLCAEALAAWSAPSAARRSLTRLLPGLLVVAFTLLSVRVAQGLADDAIVHDQLIALPGGHGPALLRRAGRLMQLADEERARSARTPVRHPDPWQDPGRAPHLRAAQEAREQAMELLLRAVRHPATQADSRAWLLLGTLQLESSVSSTALDSFKQARALEPLLAGARARELAQDPSALTRAARIYAGLARAHITQGQPARAADAGSTAARYERAAARTGGRPADSDLLFRVALMLLADGRYAEGLPLLEEVALGAEDGALRTQALAQLERGQQAAHERSSALLAQARMEQDQQQFKSAVEHYEEAMRVDASSFEARYWAAHLRGVHFGSYERALEYVEDGLVLLERPPPSAERDRQLAQLRELRQRLIDRRTQDEADGN